MDLERFRVRRGDRSILRSIAPDDHHGLSGKRDAADQLARGIERLARHQELLYAQDRRALLVVLQGMDTAGKDGIIKHVMSGVNPQGADVHSFKVPSAEELDHDFLWRSAKALPERGRIGIFNRSYYEEVVVVRVHTNLLEAERLPAGRPTPRFWNDRFDDIRNFERHLARNGTSVVKCFLHISRAEQRRRLLDRLDDPAKNWKFSAQDIVERRSWNAYMSAYGDALAATSRDKAPWYVIPADHKWYARAVVAEIIVDALAGMRLAFPPVSAAQRKVLAESRKLLRHN